MEFIIQIFFLFCVSHVAAVYHSVSTKNVGIYFSHILDISNLFKVSEMHCVLKLIMVLLKTIPKDHE